MEYESENEVKKVPIGAKVIAIIEFLLQAFALLGLVMVLVAPDVVLKAAKVTNPNARLPETWTVIAGIIASIAIIVGAAIILAKKKLGVYIFFCAFIFSFILGIILNGIGIGSIGGLVLPGLMLMFIMKDKEVFGL